MDNNFTLHISTFTDRVRAMNQQRGQDLRLSAIEANNLLADITQLAANSARLSQELLDSKEQDIQISVDEIGRAHV